MREQFKDRACARKDRSPVYRGFVALPAAVGIFFGSLIADLLFGNSIQTEDLLQVMVMPLVAGGVQFWLVRSRRS